MFLNFKCGLCNYAYVYIHTYICIYIYIYIYIYQNYKNLQICYLKFDAINDNFQAIQKLSHNSNTLILDKVWHTAMATNCLFSFTN